MMQVDVIKRAHSFRYFAATKTKELVRRDYYFPNMRKCVENVVKNCVECRFANKKMQEENWRTYHRKRKKAQYQKGELVATFVYFRSLVHEQGRWERGHQRVNEGEGFSECTRDAEVDDPGLKKERRERWPSRDPPPVVHERDA
ncbi:hypothetical protein TNCV_4425531 [Trichonephila clavipes]|nr:hypothetical protein TNCV_4425531 [Trichonephila clavipes]